MKIALLGFGIEAQSAYKYLVNKYPEAQFIVYDQNEKSKLSLPDGVECHLGVKDFSSVEADMIVRTPAVNPNNLPKNTKITSVTNLFFESCKSPIIGITGSKGKGTTSSLIAEIIRASGLNAYLVGNIGLAALDVIEQLKPQDVVVFEMSSFQLWDLEKGPHIGVFNNIEPDHLDVHADFEDYINAKSNIALTQTNNDFIIYNSCEPLVMTAMDNLKITSQKQVFPDLNRAHILDNYFYWGDTKLFSVDTLQLKGAHNQMNSLAAMTATYDLLNERGFSFSEIISAWCAGLSSFSGLDHRLQFVRNFQNIDFYDDSIATTPGSTIAALKTFNSPKILILGGSNKGADLSKLIADISSRPQNDLKQIILIGSEANKLQKALDEAGFMRYINLGDKVKMPEIVNCALGFAQAGDVVLLSPAHASFGMFASYSDRGEQFTKVIMGL